MSRRNESEGAQRSNPDLVPQTALDKQRHSKANERVKSAAPTSGVLKSLDAAKLSCLDAAVQVLGIEGRPTSCTAMIEGMSSAEFCSSSAPTPAAAMYFATQREMRLKTATARFKKSDRGQFAQFDEK